MEPQAERLHRALVAAFPGYVRSRIAGAGLPDVDEAVADATAQLDHGLARLLSLPAAEQTQSPLQVVREALSIPTQALLDVDAQPVPRDDREASLLPWDRYALAPATARDLSEEAWEAHLAWGVDKARRVAGVIPASEATSRAAHRPQIVLVSTDLMDRSKLTSIARDAGYDVEVARNPAAFAEMSASRPAVAFVDLSHAAADDAIRTFAAAGVRTVAFGPHVDDLALARA